MWLRNILFCTIAISLWSSPIQALEDIDLLDKLDALEEHVQDRAKHDEGRYYVLGMLIDCEFDEGCLLMKRKDLETFSKDKRNLILSGFLKHLKWRERDLMLNAQNCKLETKQAARKVFAACYKQFMEIEQNTPPKNRNEMDVQETNRYKCLYEKMEPLAKEGNIFAQAEMVNLSIYFKNDTATKRWYDLIKGRDDSKEYIKYLKCSEMP